MMLKSHELASKAGRPDSNDGSQRWAQRNPKNISHLGTNATRYDRHKKNVLSQAAGKQNISQRHQRTRNQATNLLRTSQQSAKNQSNDDSNQNQLSNRSINLPTMLLVDSEQQMALPAISQRFSYNSPIHKARQLQNGRESSLSAEKSQYDCFITYDQQNNDKLRDLIMKYQQKPRNGPSSDPKFLPAVTSSQGRISYQNKSIQQNRINLLNTSAIAARNFKDELQDFKGADIHRLSKAKQAESSRMEKAKQFRKQQSKVEQFLDQSPYATPQQKAIEKKQLQDKGGLSQTPNRQKTFKKRRDIVSKRQSNVNSVDLQSQQNALNSTLSNEDSDDSETRETRLQLLAERDEKYRKDVAEIVENCQKKFSSENSKAKKKAKKLQSMERQQTLERYGMYTMPTHQALVQNFKQSVQVKKQRLLSEVSKNVNLPEGMLAVTDVKNNKRFMKPNSGYQDYVNNFSHVADIFHAENNAGKQNAGFDFGKLIMQRVNKNLRQISDSEKVDQMMRETEKKRNLVQSLSSYGNIPMTMLEKAKIRPSIYQGEEQDKRTLKNVADNFSNNVLYQQRMKQRDMEEDFKQAKSPKKEIDPRIKYMKRCLQNLNMTLPILDKIYAKTLCLQDYHLSDGNCQGLAEACEFLDCKIVNRMLFNNCGISGDQLAVILEGALKMKDFKALIYKKNTINQNAIEKLIPIFIKPIPHHLEELQIIDCKLSATLVELMMDGLIENHARLKKLTLINALHSDRSFEKVIIFLQESALLQDLDLSWSGVRPQLMFKLLQAVNTNRQLVNLTLANNILLEEQKTEPTAQQIAQGMTEVELSEFNLQVVTCFKDFIKYNTRLVHLNLERCGLIQPAIKYLAALLRKSQALRCLHLCGNTGVNEELVSWVRTRIHARKEEQQVIPRAHSAQARYSNNIKGSPMKRGLMKINRGASIEFQDQLSKSKQWQDIRAGIKLRNIVQSQRMHEMNALMPGSHDAGKMIIQRKLGHKVLMPGSAQWGVYTGLKDECWICNNYTMTLFIWTPRVGLLACEKDIHINTHYRVEVEKLRKQWNVQPGHFDGCPYILGPFSNWQPVRMQEAIPYCIENDPRAPDFLSEAIKNGQVRQNCQGPDKEQMTEEESKSFMMSREKYYQQNWHRALLSIVKYKSPAVANSEAYTLLTLKQEENQPIYFHADFCKPGKNIYLVEHSRNQCVKKGFFEMVAFGQSAVEEESPEQKPGPPDLYVHQMLTQLRQEDIPVYYNQRHVNKVKSDLMRVKPVFKEWKEDSPEVLGQIFRHDWDKMLISRIVPEEEQLRRIKNEIQNNLVMFKEIYIWLQSKSSTYPYVSDAVIQQLFTDALKFGKRSYLTQASLHNIVLEVCVQGERARGEEISRIKKIQRCQFIEIMIRFAIHLYCNKLQDENEYQNLTASQAFYIFVQQKVKPYFDEQNIKGQAFREDDLWTHDIEIIYTLNETPLRALYQKYLRPRQATLSQADFEQMICRDSTLPISNAIVREAYGMSQMTVVNETNPKELENYQKTKYVEFLEVLARTADLMFEGSEMEEEPLKWKLEHVLQELFGSVLNTQFTRNRIVIEEFSDSDDDY